MNKLCISLMLFSSVLFGADLTGKWIGSIERIGGPLGGARTDEHFLTLKQTNEVITGTAGPKRDVQWEINNVKLEGVKLTFETSAPGAAKLTFAYTLQLSGDELMGTMDFKPPKDMSWKLRLKREP